MAEFSANIKLDKYKENSPSNTFELFDFVSFKVIDAFGATDDRISISVKELPQGVTRNHLTNDTVITDVTINDRNFGDFDYMKSSLDRDTGVVTLEGVVGFDEEQFNIRIINMLNAFEVPSGDDDLGSSEQWKYQLRWEQMLGGKGKLGEYITSQLEDGRSPKYREVVDILHDFGMTLFLGSGTGWPAIPIDNHTVSIVPLGYNHTAKNLTSARKSRSTVSDHLSSADVNYRCFRRGYYFDVPVAIETQSSGDVKEIDLYRGGIVDVEGKDVNISTITDENDFNYFGKNAIDLESFPTVYHGVVHMEGQRVRRFYDSETLSTTILLDETISPRDGMLTEVGEENYDAWIVSRAEHDPMNNITSLVMYPDATLSMNDVTSGSPYPFNSDVIPSRLGDVPGKPKVLFIEDPVSAKVALGSLTPDQIAGLATELQEMYLNDGTWTPSSSTVILALDPSEVGLPLTHYETILTNTLTGDEVATNIPAVAGTQIAVADNVRCQVAYKVSVTAYNAFGASETVDKVHRYTTAGTFTKFTDVNGVDVAFPTLEFPQITLPCKPPEITSLGYIPSEQAELAALTKGEGLGAAALTALGTSALISPTVLPIATNILYLNILNNYVSNTVPASLINNNIKFFITQAVKDGLITWRSLANVLLRAGGIVSLIGTITSIGIDATIAERS